MVQDETGAILRDASVMLAGADGAVIQTVSTDAAGSFRFDNVVPGSYEIRVNVEGFKPASTRLRLGTHAPSAQKVVLSLAQHNGIFVSL